MAGTTQAMSVLVTFVVVTLSLRFSVTAAAPLTYNFYATSCPKAEKIIPAEMTKIFNTVDPTLEIGPNVAPDLLRLHFHDCFVGNGSDASVLLDGPGTEKMAAPNASLEGFDFVDTIKAALEAACPGVVSCADLLAYAARDAVILTAPAAKKALANYAVPGGRRNGFTSNRAGAVKKLPSPTMSVGTLARSFARHGLTMKDMVVLSGAHTIGDTACHHIDNRLFKFPKSKTGVDPSLPPAFVTQLKLICPTPGLQLITVDLDQVTPITFDVQYYKNLQAKKSVLSSDQILFTDARTRPTVNSLARSTNLFFREFAKSMVKMGSVGTLRGTAGEVRLNCRVRNPVAPPEVISRGLELFVDDASCNADGRRKCCWTYVLRRTTLPYIGSVDPDS